MYLRKKFTKWNTYWRYPDIKELKTMLDSFNKIEYKTHGFLGVFGRKEWQSNILGIVDNFICNFIPEDYKYISYWICDK